MKRDKILLLTVGGSPDPLVTAVEELQPSRVIFFASKKTATCVDGPNKPNKKYDKNHSEIKLDNLITLMQLHNSYDKSSDLIVLEDEDSLQDSYEQMLDKVTQLKQLGPTTIAIDYTGGTKTMCAALAMVALDEDLDIHVTTGLRDDTRSVRTGQTTREVSMTNVRTRRQLSGQVSRRMKSFDYRGAVDLLKNLSKPASLDKTLRHEIDKIKRLTECLTAWDIFNHQEALDLIEDNEAFKRSENIRNRLLQPLKRLVDVRTWLDSKDSKPPNNTSGYELVEDLLLNAERRALSNRYDDAVGRYYRALEMIAQIRARMQFDILTGKVRRDQVAENCQEKYFKHDEAEAKLGLRDTFALLSDNNDPLIAPLWQAEGKILLNALSIRNNSLFAHGYQPISKNEYEQFKQESKSFCETLLDKLFGKSRRTKQLPNNLDEVQQWLKLP